jgi:hypothetical protein
VFFISIKSIPHHELQIKHVSLKCPLSDFKEEVTTHRKRILNSKPRTSRQYSELKQIRVPPGIDVDCELFDPPLKASEIEEIRIH